MKSHILTHLIYFGLFLNVTFGQQSFQQYASLEEWTTNKNQIDSILEQYFDAGAMNFYKILYKNVKYPREAYNNCNESLVLIEMIVSNNTQKITILNNIDPIFEQEVNRIFGLTANHWTVENDTIQLHISIYFTIEVV